MMAYGTWDMAIDACRMQCTSCTVGRKGIISTVARVALQLRWV